MTLFKMLKKNAKLALDGNWGKAVFVLLILIVITLILTGVQQYAMDLFVGADPANIAGENLTYFATEAEIVILSVFSLLTVLFLFPLEIGTVRWFFRLVYDRKMAVSDVFVFFEDVRKYFKSIRLYLNIFIRGLLWSFVFYTAPSALLGVSMQLVNGKLLIVGDNSRLNATFGTMGITLSLVLLVLATILYVIFMNRYTLTFYLYFDDMDISARMAIKTSVKYSRGFRLSFFLFNLSFIGWAILCILIIPIFYVLPYYYTSHAMYARYIIEKNRATLFESTREFTTPETGRMEDVYEKEDCNMAGDTAVQKENNAFPEQKADTDAD